MLKCKVLPIQPHRSPQMYNSRTNQRIVEIVDVVADSGVVSHETSDSGANAVYIVHL